MDFYKHGNFDKTFLLRFANSSLSQVSLSALNYEYISFREGQATLYAELGPNRNQLTGIYRMSGFENSPIFSLAKNNLKHMYRFHLYPGHTDKLVIAAEVKDGEHSIIELHPNGTVQREHKVTGEVYTTGYWVY